MMTPAPRRGALTLSVMTLIKSVSYSAEAFSSTKDSGVDLPGLSLNLGLHTQLTKGLPHLSHVQEECLQGAIIELGQVGLWILRILAHCTQQLLISA